MRAVALGEPPSGAEDLAAALLQAQAPEDRAAGAFALALLDPDAGAKLVAARDPVAARAAARAMLASGFTRQAAERLATETDPLMRSALALALADDAAQSAFRTRCSKTCSRARGRRSPRGASSRRARQRELSLACRAVARESRREGPGHAASGLALSGQASAVGLLERAYVDEVDATARRAIVRAPGVRSEPGRRRVLDLAAALEPDDEAHARAARAAGKLNRRSRRARRALG